MSEPEPDGSFAPLQVEKAPIVIKSGMKKEDAEALKLKLEAGALPIHFPIVSSLSPLESGFRREQASPPPQQGVAVGVTVPEFSASVDRLSVLERSNGACLRLSVSLLAPESGSQS